MAIQFPFVEIPFGSAGQIARVNRMKADPTELLIAQGVTLEDSTMRKEAGAVKLDDAGISGAPKITSAYDWNPQFEDTSPTGDIDTAADSQNVVGNATQFLSEVNVGDYIKAAGEVHRVIEVTSDTALVTASEWVTTNTTEAFTIVRQQRLITAADDGNIYVEVNGDLDADQAVTGLVESRAPGRFVSAGKEAAALDRKLFYFSGRDPVQVIPSSTFTGGPVSSPPSDWAGTNQPVNGVVHENRVIAFGNDNDPHRIYISTPDNHEEFNGDDAADMRVVSEVGDKLWCGVRFNGILHFWKHPFGIAYLCDNSTSVADWCIRLKTAAIGCAPSPYAALGIDDDVLFMAADGSFHLLTAVQELGGTRSSDLSYALGISDWLRTHVNLSRLDLVQSIWYQHKKVALFLVPSTDSLENDLLLKFDFGGVANGEPVKFSWTSRDEGAIALRRDVDTIPRPITGEGAFVWLHEQAARTKGGAYTALVQTPHSDYAWADPALRGKRKQWEGLELVMNPKVGTITVQVYVDQVLTDSFTIDANQRRAWHIIQGGDGYTVSFVFSNSADNEDFEILSALVWVHGLAEADHSRRV